MGVVTYSKKVCSVDQIRAVEAKAFQEEPSYHLMERAGHAIAKAALRMIPSKQKKQPILVIAGPGNNGGDAFIAAQFLAENGYVVKVSFLGEEDRLPADALQACQTWLKSNKNIHSTLLSGQYSLIIDGLFGIGLSRNLSALAQKWIREINARETPILAIDLPSGLDGDTGKSWGEVVRATRTVTFFASKLGIYSGRGPDFCGEIEIEDLGYGHAIPRTSGGLVDKILDASCLYKGSDSHKGSYGTLEIVGGARGMVGALALASRAAVATGAGKVFATPIEDINFPFDPVCPEVMWRRCPKQSAQCTVAGVGMGTSVKSIAIIDSLLKNKNPLLLDADALTIISQSNQYTKTLLAKKEPILMTPHPGEAAKLLSCEVSYIQNHRLASAQLLSEKFGAYVALKGVGTILCNPYGDWAVNESGNPSLAQAGSGDILSGIIGSLVCQSNDPEFALHSGVWLHGAAADEIIEEEGHLSVSLRKLIDKTRKILGKRISVSINTPEHRSECS